MALQGSEQIGNASNQINTNRVIDKPSDGVAKSISGHLPPVKNSIWQQRYVSFNEHPNPCKPCMD